MSIVQKEIQEIETIIQDLEDSLESIASHHVLYESMKEDLHNAKKQLQEIKLMAKKAEF
jgi:prefoldin subunit 5